MNLWKSKNLLKKFYSNKIKKMKFIIKKKCSWCSEGIVMSISIGWIEVESIKCQDATSVAFTLFLSCQLGQMSGPFSSIWAFDREGRSSMGPHKPWLVPFLASFFHFWTLACLLQGYQPLKATFVISLYHIKLLPAPHHCVSIICICPTSTWHHGKPYIYH